ncbi:MAG: cold-shock protein [Bacteroidetes bacterium]|jgi:CspA family cold shock protein|nr:cold-shock protein [Bacteroidota bacterium]
MPRGKVKWFSIEKGFGFLVPDDGGRDVFVHRSQVNGLGYDEALIENEEVEFEVEKGPKGLSAQNVTRLG